MPKCSEKISLYFFLLLDKFFSSLHIQHLLCLLQVRYFELVACPYKSRK